MTTRIESHALRGCPAPAAIGLKALTAVVLCLVLLAHVGSPDRASAGSTKLGQSQTITVPTSGKANPYPSAISVSGYAQDVANIVVTITGVTHTHPADLDIMLVGPQGQKVVLMSDVGGGYDLVNTTLAFDDHAPTTIAAYRQIQPGTYRPTNAGSVDSFPSPAPTGARSTSLSAFNGIDPNGTWTLYVIDDVHPDGGTITGWGLTIVTGTAPVIDPISTLVVAENETHMVPIAASDVDGQTIALSVEGLPAFGSFRDNGDGTGDITLTPGFADSGSYAGATVLATDGDYTTRRPITISVTNVNRAPVIDPIADLSVVAGRELIVPIQASDPDGNALTLSATDLPLWAELTDNRDGTGTLTLRPGNADGGTIHTSSISVSDAEATVGQPVTITVAPNTAPVIDPIDDQVVAEGSVISFDVSATDADGETMSLAVSGLPAFSTVSEVSAGHWTVMLAPGYEHAGVYRDVILQVSDGGFTATRTISIDVAATNRGPSLSGLTDQNIAEARQSKLLLTASDSDQDPVSFSAAALPVFVSLQDKGDGTADLTIAPQMGDAGTYADLSVTVSDGTLQATTTFTLTISPNGAPVVSLVDQVSLVENSTTPISVTSSDPDNDAIVLTAEELPPFATFTDHGDGTGTFTFAPDFESAGTYSVTLNATDGGYAVTKPLTIVVSDVNRAPTFEVSQSLTVREGRRLVTSIRAVDPDGDPVTIDVTNLPHFGSSEQALDGSVEIRFAPQMGDASTYGGIAISANDGAAVTGANVSLTVLPNDPPVLEPIGDLIVNDGATTDVLIQATSTDNDALVISAEGLPGFASLDDHGNGTATLTLTPGPTGSDEYAGITIRVSDGLAEDSEVLNLTVLDVNQAPVADAGEGISFPDIDGDGIESVALDGSASLDTDGTIVAYAWRLGETIVAETASATVPSSLGTHTFTLTTTDDDGDISSDTVTMEVTDVTAPTVTVSLSEPANGAGWHKRDVTISFSAQDTSGGSGLAELVVGATGAQPLAMTSTTNPSSSMTITTLGETRVSWYAVDAAGNQGATETMSIKLDKISPKATAARHRLVVDDVLRPTSVPVMLEWSTSDVGSGIERVVLQADSGNGFWNVGLPSTTETSSRRYLQPGVAVTHRTRATDMSGRKSLFMNSAPVLVELHEETSPSIAFGAGNWGSMASSGFSGGGSTFASMNGSVTTFTFTGSSIGWVSRMNSSSGKAEVRIDGNLISVVDLYASQGATRKLVFVENNLDPNREHTIEIRVQGRRNPLSTGYRVDVDAFVVVK